MTWHYHAKNIPAAKLPAYKVFLEWYKVCDEDGVQVRPQRAATADADCRPQQQQQCTSAPGSNDMHPLTPAPALYV